MENVRKAKLLLQQALNARAAAENITSFEKENGLPLGTGYAYMTGSLVAYIELALMELEED